MQVCCGRAGPTIWEVIKAKHPECTPENMEGNI